MITHALGGFRLALPDGYAEAACNGRLVFTGPDGEEIAGSSAAVEGEGPEARRRMLRDRLVQGAIRDVQRAACQPDLEVVVPLAHAPGADGIETWNLVTRSAAGRLFAQAVVASEGAVAVLSFQGRNERGAVGRWFAVLEAVRPGSAT